MIESKERCYWNSSQADVFPKSKERTRMDEGFGLSQKIRARSFNQRSYWNSFHTNGFPQVRRIEKFGEGISLLYRVEIMQSPELRRNLVS